MIACEPPAGMFCILAFFNVARLILNVACPGAFAWNVKVKTCPSPLIPLLPGGRDAVNCRIPIMLSSR